MSRMVLPYFAALGQYHYQRSVYLYLQIMSQIHVTHRGLHKPFINGLHVIRRSNCFCTGVSPDLLIEQVLMCMLKTSGDFTRGRELNEKQQAIWLLSMHVMADINRVMQDFPGAKYQTSDQHEDTAQARTTKNHSDGF